MDLKTKFEAARKRVVDLYSGDVYWRTRRTEEVNTGQRSEKNMRNLLSVRFREHVARATNEVCLPTKGDRTTMQNALLATFPSEAAGGTATISAQTA